VSVKAEAASLLREMVAPPAPGESVKALIGRAARASGLSFIRAKKLWYGEAQTILAEEMDALRATTRRRCGDKNAVRSESQTLGASIERIEAELARLRSHLEGLAAAPPR
jgi:hypothetical protein